MNKPASRTYFVTLPFTKQVSLHKKYERKRRAVLTKAHCRTFKEYLSYYHNCIYKNRPTSNGVRVINLKTGTL